MCFAKRHFGCKNRYFGAARPAWPGSSTDGDEARDVFGVAGVAATIGVATVGAAAAAAGVTAVIDIITTGVTVLGGNSYGVGVDIIYGVRQKVPRLLLPCTVLPYQALLSKRSQTLAAPERGGSFSTSRRACMTGL